MDIEIGRNLETSCTSNDLLDTTELEGCQFAVVFTKPNQIIAIAPDCRLDLIRVNTIHARFTMQLTMGNSHRNPIQPTADKR